MRIEKDSFGELEIPDEAYYGVTSLRSRENFNVAGERLPLEITYGMVKLKWACAVANHKLGLLAADKAGAIEAACRLALEGKANDHFIVDTFQAGSGTSSNMNTNEVLANLAAEQLGGKRGDRGLVHPNDDVNKGQSTNNIFPSGIKVACVDLSKKLKPALQHLASALRAKAEEFKDVIKSGRTHLQDAVPVTMGQEFSAYARSIEKDILRLDEAVHHILELGVGGNAVGTGVNTKAEFRPEIMKALGAITGDAYRVAEDGLECTQFLTDLGQFSAVLRLIASDITKICNDLRLMASGPNTGMAEIVLPPVEPGSSIMPGKINPSICEASNMACIQVMGNDHAVQVAVSLGQLELNTHMPVIGANLVKSMNILERCCRSLADKCIVGIKVDRERCYSYFENSGGLGTVLNPKLGYDRVSELVKESLKSKKTARQLVVEKGIMTDADFDKLVQKCTGPNLN